MQETQVRSLGGEEPLEKEMARSPVFPRTEEAGGATVHRVPKESDTTTATSESTATFRWPLASLKFVVSHLEKIRVNMLGKV